MSAIKRIQIDELRRKLKAVPREGLTQSGVVAAILELDERLRRVEGWIDSASPRPAADYEQRWDSEQGYKDPEPPR